MKNKEKKLYLSDSQPLDTVGVISLILSYIILIAWAILIIWPLAIMIISSFNGEQEGIFH